MKNTSQQYLNSEAHGYLMEAKACKLLLKDLERIRAKLKRHIEKEAADREAEFEAAMQYHSESDIQEAYGWEFISVVNSCGRNTFYFRRPYTKPKRVKK